MSLRPILLAATAALALGACGKRGSLDRPPPLWSHAQPVRSNQDKPQVPETQNVPIPAQPVETGKSDPVGASPVEPHAQ
jgi:predicted small lipoprotein YifL